jgi:hypothetical protein
MAEWRAFLRNTQIAHYDGEANERQLPRRNLIPSIDEAAMMAAVDEEVGDGIIISVKAGDGIIISKESGDGRIISTVSIAETRTEVSRD